MTKYKQRLESIDKFIESLEEMIDARDDMWEEEKYSNWRQVLKIKQDRYSPARERMKSALHDFILEVMDEDI